jgi:hypothetical protein
VLWIADLDRVPPPARQLLEEALARRQFLPVIRRIRSVTWGDGPSEWEVETDRGPTRFRVQREEDVHALTGHRALVIDAHGLRYLIPDTRALDGGSRRLLSRFI